MDISWNSKLQVKCSTLQTPKMKIDHGCNCLYRSADQWSVQMSKREIDLHRVFPITLIINKSTHAIKHNRKDETLATGCTGRLIKCRFTVSYPRGTFANRNITAAYFPSECDALGRKSCVHFSVCWDNISFMNRNVWTLIGMLPVYQVFKPLKWHLRENAEGRKW